MTGLGGRVNGKGERRALEPLYEMRWLVPFLICIVLIKEVSDGRDDSASTSSGARLPSNS